MRLRSHLVALVLAALVPVLGFAALVIRENTRLQLAATERGMRETAHAVAATVDKELDTAITALESLAESEQVDAADLHAFHTLCRRIVHTQGWTSILLFAADGRGLMHTALPLGSPLPTSLQSEAFLRARDSRQPAVSNLFDGVRHAHIVSVYVPVLRDKQTRFILAAGLPASSFGEVLRAQQFGPGTVAAVQDRADVLVARTHLEAQMVGQKQRRPGDGREGWRRRRQPDGVDGYVAFAVAPLSGWTVVLITPASVIDGPMHRALTQLLGGAALAAGLATLLAFGFGRRIANAVGSLVRIARAVERRDRAEPLRTGLTEVNVVAEQLRAAAELARTREHDSAVRERQARAMAEVSRALNASLDLDGVLRTVVNSVGSLVQADSARIALVDEAGRLILRYSTRPSPAMPAGFVIERGRGLGGLAWSTARPVRSENFAADARFRNDRYLPIVRADGIVACMAVPIVTAEAVVGVIYANNVTARVFTDGDEAVLVTLAHHAAVAVQKARLLAAEHAARAEAEAASRGKDELLAMLGHELRNPLAAITTAMHVLERPTATEDARRLARGIITRQNAHLARLVDDLLDVARVSSGKITLERRPLDLAGAVRNAIATLTASGRTERHHVTLELASVWAEADDTRIEQIVINLVGNALRFTPSGGTVEVSLHAADGRGVLRVHDSGVGIPATMLPRVFDAFVQGPRGPGAGTGGLGLGLTLVKRIAELHGGDVEAASDGPGRGSTFTVRIPAVAAPPAAEPAPAVPAEASARRRVLIVEDNDDTREMLRVALDLSGHEVHEAIDGPSGLAAMLRLRPDIALVDIGLPEFDGYEIARKTRTALGGGVYLVALTGYGQPDDRRQAIEAGFDTHLVKPVGPEALLSVIQSAPVV
ncbi:MAG TPA: ATP-binding protein [Methylomirabilota bacterium]|nr:ATP-binding protein [Methylomirabilota bacterium]